MRPFIFAASLAVAYAKTLIGIPTLEFNVTSTTQFPLSKVTHVLVDSRFQSTVDLNGKTLIPPTLLAFAHTFASDLVELGLHVPVQVASSAQPGSVFLTISSDHIFLDAAGRNTSERYTFTVGTGSVIISGASPLGAWWGTRTLIQQAKLGDLKLPLGSGNDVPGWGTRGLVQNTFHVHLSDNLFNNVDLYSRERSLDLYAAFRLNSDDPVVAGLVRPYRVNETYSRETFLL
ncbi:hypothetical protein C8R46DRAFT_1193793 [Mycena filopes]|nr:hypothetical protein C8R46DRAFT_1193793 [Mycena filopes]